MVQFTVQYGQGKTLTKRNTIKEPVIQFAGEPTVLYTLVMSDPDAAAKSWLHWLITNIPGESNDITQGETVLEYTGPNPPSGTHRYIFTLYQQPGGSLMVSPPEERGHFPVDVFEKQYRLQPVARRIVKVAK